MGFRATQKTVKDQDRATGPSRAVGRGPLDRGPPLSKTRNFKVALNPIYRIFSNFDESYMLSCLSKFCNKKKFHRAVFEI